MSITNCKNCGHPLSESVCPACGTHYISNISAKERCFYHSNKRSTSYCRKCNRYICTECVFNDKHYTNELDICIECYKEIKETELICASIKQSIKYVIYSIIGFVTIIILLFLYSILNELWRFCVVFLGPIMSILIIIFTISIIVFTIYWIKIDEE